MPGNLAKLVRQRPTTMRLSTLLCLVPLTLASPTNELAKRQWTESKHCTTGTRPLCYLEIALRGANPVFRIAVPDTANPPFDTILEITTPNSLAWTGFAWGGGMTLNPLTVVWPNGNAGKATVSSRWSSYVLPLILKATPPSPWTLTYGDHQIAAAQSQPSTPQPHTVPLVHRVTQPTGPSKSPALAAPSGPAAS